MGLQNIYTSLDRCYRYLLHTVIYSRYGHIFVRKESNMAVSFIFAFLVIALATTSSYRLRSKRDVEAYDTQDFPTERSEILVEQDKNIRANR